MSLGAADRQIVEEIVEEWVRGENMFTAFDVSLEAKRRGAQCRHRDMKPAIHEQMRYNRDYTRQQIQINGASGRPYLYFLVGADPDEYEPLDRSKFDDDMQFDGHKVAAPAKRICNQVDKRGRYCVRSSFVADAGFDKGDAVSIFVNSDEITIAPITYPDPNNSAKTYKVDKDRNIRISKTLLDSAFGNSFSSIKCEVDGQKIVVESL